MKRQPVGIKADDNKRRYDLLPLEAIDEVVKVLTFGAGKYGAENWRKIEHGKARYFAAALRHLDHAAQRVARERDLQESNLSPLLAHAVCCVLFMLESLDE